MIHGVRGRGRGEWSPREHHSVGDNRGRRVRMRAEERVGEAQREARWGQYFKEVINEKDQKE